MNPWLLLALIIAIGLLIYLLQRRQPLAPNSSGLKRRVIRLLAGNEAAADRLLIQAKQRNPGRSDAWCWEKIIDDLERDRR